MYTSFLYTRRCTCISKTFLIEKQNYFSNGTLHWITEEPVQGTGTPGYIQHKDPRERCQQGRRVSVTKPRHCPVSELTQPGGQSQQGRGRPGKFHR